MSLLMQGGWNEVIFKVPSNPYHFMILWFYDNNEFRTHALLQLLYTIYFCFGSFHIAKLSKFKDSLADE